MKKLIILGLAVIGGYFLYKNYSGNMVDDSVLPSPDNSDVKKLASQPQQVRPLTTVLDLRDDGQNQPWYIGPQSVLSTPLSDILGDFETEDFPLKTAPLI